MLTLFSLFKPTFASWILQIQKGANNKTFFLCFQYLYSVYLEDSGKIQRKPNSPHCSFWRFLMWKIKKLPKNSFYITFSFGQYFVGFFFKISKTCTQCKNNNWKMSNFLLSGRGVLALFNGKVSNLFFVLIFLIGIITFSPLLYMASRLRKVVLPLFSALAGANLQSCFQL